MSVPYEAYTNSGAIAFILIAICFSTLFAWVIVESLTSAGTFRWRRVGYLAISMLFVIVLFNEISTSLLERKRILYIAVNERYIVVPMDMPTGSVVRLKNGKERTNFYLVSPGLRVLLPPPGVSFILREEEEEKGKQKTVRVVVQ